MKAAWAWPRWPLSASRAGKAVASPKTAPAAPQIKRQPSLVRRLIVLHGALSAVVLIAGGFALSTFFEQRVTAQFDQRLQQDIIDMVGGASVDDTGGVDAPALTDERTEQVYSGKYWEMIEAPPGAATKAVARSRSLWDAPDIALPAGGAATLAAQPGQTLFYDGQGPAPLDAASPSGGGPKVEPVRIAAEEVRISGAKNPVIFLVAENRTPIDDNIRFFDASTGLALLVLMAMLVAGVALQVRVGLRPLFDLRREVAAVRTGKTSRVAGAYPAELEPLAAELNALVTHNQDVVDRQRTHVGNLAHALKTPLSVMAAESEAQPGPLADLVRRQSAVMREQVDHHLRRARAAARPQGGGERTPVAEVLEELALTLERIFRDKGVEVDWRADDDLFFHGERQDFMELAGNVMENACKWCKGRVRATALATGPATLSLSVEDDGPGLPPEDRAQVLQRGERLDESAPGSGLGLNIVDELAKAYGGALDLGDAQIGGLRVTVTLPRAEA